MDLFFDVIGAADGAAVPAFEKQSYGNPRHAIIPESSAYGCSFKTCLRIFSSAASLKGARISLPSYQ